MFVMSLLLAPEASEAEITLLLLVLILILLLVWTSIGLGHIAIAINISSLVVPVRNTVSAGSGRSVFRSIALVWEFVFMADQTAETDAALGTGEGGFLVNLDAADFPAAMLNWPLLGLKLDEHVLLLTSSQTPLSRQLELDDTTTVS
jgi:hypothetical protein